MPRTWQFSRLPFLPTPSCAYKNAKPCQLLETIRSVQCTESCWTMGRLRDVGCIDVGPNEYARHDQRSPFWSPPPEQQLEECQQHSIDEQASKHFRTCRSGISSCSESGCQIPARKRMSKPCGCNVRAALVLGSRASNPAPRIYLSMIGPNFTIFSCNWPKNAPHHRHTARGSLQRPRHTQYTLSTPMSVDSFRSLSQDVSRIKRCQTRFFPSVALSQLAQIFRLDEAPLATRAERHSLCL
jgi:hypothetical protein